MASSALQTIPKLSSQREMDVYDTYCCCYLEGTLQISGEGLQWATLSQPQLDAELRTSQQWSRGENQASEPSLCG